MDDTEALHAAARRYSIERESALREQIHLEIERERHLRGLVLGFAEDTSGRLSERLDVIQGVLRRIEAVVPGASPSVDVLRTFLLETARLASHWEDTRPLSEAAGQIVSWSEPSKKAQQAGADERARFRAYIETLESEDLNGIEPLPYRRLLTEREAERLWRRLSRKWQIPSKDYWWPLGSQEVPPPHVLAFDDGEFDQHIPLALLASWLREARARPIVRFDSDNPGEDYEMDLD